MPRDNELKKKTLLFFCAYLIDVCAADCFCTFEMTDNFIFLLLRFILRFLKNYYATVGSK